MKEITAGNLPNLGKETVTQVQEAQNVPYRLNPKTNTPRHTVIKMTNIKDKRENTKSNKGKATNNIQGNPHKVIS